MASSQELKEWLDEVKTKTPVFLSDMAGETTPGFYRYSLTGDLFDEQALWGLGNTVFAVKSYYTLGLLDALGEQREQMVQFIESFRTRRGQYVDPLVARKAFWREKLSGLRHRDVQNFFHAQTARAETRQSISALELLGEQPSVGLGGLPRTHRDIDGYLGKLNWSKPWGAGSHFSHLLFFLHRSELPDRDRLVQHAIDWVNQLQDSKSGSWFRGAPSLQQKINGAMKILTGLKSAERMEFDRARELVDLALQASHDPHACNLFNVIYVLKYANESLGGAYRPEEIHCFAIERLELYRKHWWPEHGGFSFFERNANTYYYKAIITNGLPEPDIHGTALLLWGISLIEQLLYPVEQRQFHEFIP